MSEIEERQGNKEGTDTSNAGFSWDTQGSGVQTQPGINDMQPEMQSGFQSQIPPQGQFFTGGQGPQPVPVQPAPEKKKSILPLIITLSAVVILLIGGAVAGAIFAFKGSLSNVFGVKEQSLELSETSVVTLIEGEDFILSIENYDELDERQNIQWESSDNRIITVKDKGDGKAKITAVAEGKGSVFITGENLDKKKGYVVKFDVEKEPFEYAGKAWKTMDNVYYFPDEDSLCDFSDFDDYYMYGPVTVTEFEENDASWRVTDYVSGGRYFRFDYRPEREIEYGSPKSITSEYEIWFGINKKGELYIYDESNGYTDKATEIDIKDYDKSLSDDDSIQAFLDDKTSGLISYSSGRMDLYGSEFDTNDAFHDNTRLIQCGDTVYIRCDDGVYSLSASALGTGNGKPSKVNLSDDKVVYFATDGEKMVYAAGDTKSDVDLYIYDPATGKDSLLLSGISCMHMAFCDDKVYYTEFWDSLKYVDMSGNTNTIWQNYVVAFWADTNFVYIYDGADWAMLNISAGYVSDGYLCQGRNYECDRIYALEDNIITVIYDDADSTVSLHGVDFAGKEGELGQRYYGIESDTYALACCGKYGYFLAYEGEVVVCVDITTGSCYDVNLSDYGLWYANEMSVVGDRVVLHVYDSNGDDGYVEVDSGLNLYGLPELPHSITANSEAGYLF